MTWTNKTIGDWADVIGGGTPSTRATEFWGGDIPWFTPGEIPESGAGIVRNSNRLITKAGLARSAAKMLPVGSVLVTSRASIGNCAIAGVPMTTNQGFTSLVPKDSRSSLFLYYWVQQNRHQFLSRSAGSTFLEISVSKVRDIEISSPGLPEQAAIGEAIADADHLITTLERLIAKKQAIKQGMMQQLLTGRTRLPGFTDEWQSRQLGELLIYEQPGQYLVSSTDYTEVGTPVLTAGKTFMLGHTTERHGIFRNLPVIIFDDFTTASKFVEFPFKAKSSAMKMLSARPGVNLRFVFERMQLIDFATVDHKRRWIAEFSKIEVAVPAREEQDQISTVLEDADSGIAKLELRLEKARAIKTGMMQQLLTGRVRLPVEDES